MGLDQEIRKRFGVHEGDTLPNKARNCSREMLAKFMGEMIEGAKELGIPVKTLKVSDSIQAREMPFAYGTCGVFYGGNLLAHGILTRKEFTKSLTAAKK